MPRNNSLKKKNKKEITEFSWRSYKGQRLKHLCKNKIKGIIKE
jgi:hypothetical protein